MRVRVRMMVVTLACVFACVRLCASSDECEYVRVGVNVNDCARVSMYVVWVLSVCVCV